MFPVGMFPAGLFAPGMFPPGAGGVEITGKKFSGTRFKRPIIRIIEKELEEAGTTTAFSKAFRKAAQVVSREEKIKVLAEKVESENLQGLGKIGRLSDDDIALILLLID